MFENNRAEGRTLAPVVPESTGLPGAPVAAGTQGAAVVAELPGAPLAAAHRRRVAVRAGYRTRALLADQRGMSTAEYAVGTIAAVAFAGILLKVVTSPTVHAALQAILARALK